MELKEHKIQLASAVAAIYGARPRIVSFTPARVKAVFAGVPR